MNPSVTPQQVGSYVLGAFTAVVTEAVALVPAWAPAEKAILSGGGIVVTAGVLVAGAIHHLASTKNLPQILHEEALSAEDKLRAQLHAAGLTPGA